MIALPGDLKRRHIEVEGRQFLAQCFALCGDKEPMQLLFKSIEIRDGLVWAMLIATAWSGLQYLWKAATILKR